MVICKVGVVTHSPDSSLHGMIISNPSERYVIIHSVVLTNLDSEGGGLTRGLVIDPLRYCLTNSVISMKTYAHIYSYIPESMRLTERKLEQMRGELIEAISRNLPFSKNDLSVLMTRELYIIAARFGFLNGEEATLEAIGNSLGVTRQRVHYLLRRALNRIRRLNQGMA
jgi:hypothetical protein